MIEITYKPSDAGTTIVNKRGKKIKIRKYHMTDEELEVGRKKWQEEVSGVDIRTRNKAGSLFFNPYRRGIYYYQLQSLFLLGANEWHSFPRVLSSLQSYMSDIKLLTDPIFDNVWEKFRGKSARSRGSRCKDYQGRIQENFIFFQRLTKKNPYGYKLHQVGAAIDIKRVSRDNIENGVFSYRLSTYDDISKAYPMRDYRKFVMPRHERKYVSRKFIGTVITKGGTVCQGVEL